jgi:hypothetical protein
MEIYARPGISKKKRKEEIDNISHSPLKNSQNLPVHQLLAENVVANIETLQKKIGLLTRK